MNKSDISFKVDEIVDGLFELKPNENEEKEIENKIIILEYCLTTMKNKSIASEEGLAQLTKNYLDMLKSVMLLRKTNPYSANCVLRSLFELYAQIRLLFDYDKKELNEEKLKSILYESFFRQVKSEETMRELYEDIPEEIIKAAEFYKNKMKEDRFKVQRNKHKGKDYWYKSYKGANGNNIHNITILLKEAIKSESFRNESKGRELLVTRLYDSLCTYSHGVFLPPDNENIYGESVSNIELVKSFSNQFILCLFSIESIKNK